MKILKGTLSHKWFQWKYVFLWAFLILDSLFSIYQFSLTSIDGDFVGGILPSSELSPLFEDPFGFKALFSGTPHENPNRYFSHLLFLHYFKSIPFLFQNFLDPIRSLYWSFAAIKFSTHLGFLIALPLIAKRIQPRVNLLFILAVTTCLLQTNGYGTYIRIVDSSISYLFFYGFPLMLFAFFVLFWTSQFNKGWMMKIALISCIVILSFSGPLIPALLVLFLSLWVLISFRKERELKSHHIVAVIGVFVGLYSLALGRINSVHFTEVLSLPQRYSRLPIGIFNVLFQKGWFLFFIFEIALLTYFKPHFWRKYRNVFIWGAFFILLYLIFLPFGGYRPYRPNIIRFDTFAPVYCCLLIGILLVHSYLFEALSKKGKVWSILNLVVFLFIYSNADKLPSNSNRGERMVLYNLRNKECSNFLISSRHRFMRWDFEKNKNYKKEVLALKMLGIINRDISISETDLPPFSIECEQTNVFEGKLKN